MRVVFPFPRAYGYFPDIYEYVTALRARGVDAHYVGIQPSMVEQGQPPYTTHLEVENASRRRFIEFSRDAIAALQPDIVHVFHFRGCGMLPLLARQSERKWVADVRTIHVETKDMTVGSDFWIRDRLTWLETQTYDQVLALTEKIAAMLRPSVRPVQLVPLGASAGKLNPPDLDERRATVRNQLAIPEHAPVILYAGTLSPTRRLDKILSGFAQTTNDWPEARLLVAGGEAGHMAATDPSIVPLRQQAETLGIASRVLFTGRVPYWEVPDYFAAADIGVSFMPVDTPHQFQPPTKLIEYMMAGLIATSNDIPAIDGLIEDGVQGILFGDDESEITVGLSRALSLLQLERTAERQQLIANASERVRERDWQQIVDTYLIPTYEQLIHK